MKKIAFLIVVLALGTWASAQAATTDQIVDMAKKGTPEDQLLKEIDMTPGDFELGATQVIALREAKVSDKVIAAMLRHVGNQAQAPQQPRVAQPVPQPQQPFAPQAPVARPIQPAAVTPQNVQAALANSNTPGRLTIDNLDDRTYAYFYEPAIQTLWIGPPNGNSGSVTGHTAQTLSMKAGQYRIRYQGQTDEGVTVTVYPGDLSSIGIARVMIDNAEVLQATAYERGERKATGRLAPMAALAPAPVVVQRQVVEVPTYVERPTYYYDSPTVIYGGPSYYSRGGYYSRPYYGGGSYYRGGGSSFSLGIGVGGGSNWRR